MNNQRDHGLNLTSARTLAVGIALLSAFSANAAHELLYATGVADNRLYSFYNDTPGTILTSLTISGLHANEAMVGIDSWDGTLYGVGSANFLYTINPNTGQATAVNTTPFSYPLNGTWVWIPGVLEFTGFGVANSPGGLRVVSLTGQNLLVNRATGNATAGPSLSYPLGDPHAGAVPLATALGYDSTSGKFYVGISEVRSSVESLDPVTGICSTLGQFTTGPFFLDPLQLSFTNGFDISPVTGTAYLANGDGFTGASQAALYTVDMTTLRATLVGQIGSPQDGIIVSGLTVAVIPEPTTAGILALGGLLLAWFPPRPDRHRRGVEPEWHLVKAYIFEPK